MYSNAESNVIAYLEMGWSNSDIADKLCVCEKTIKFHLTSIYKKANVKSRSEFMAKKNEKDSKITRGQIMTQVSKENTNLPTRQVSQEDKIQFIDKKFQVGKTIDTLHKMMDEVTKDEINPSTVNAACNCVARLNETINTAIMAAKFLNER